MLVSPSRPPRPAVPPGQGTRNSSSQPPWQPGHGCATRGLTTGSVRAGLWPPETRRSGQCGLFCGGRRGTDLGPQRPWRVAGGSSPGQFCAVAEVALLAVRPPARPFVAPGGRTPFLPKLLGVGCVGTRTEPAAYGPSRALSRSVLTVTPRSRHHHPLQQTGKLRHEEANELAQGFTAGERRGGVWVHVARPRSPYF